jgi:glycosyltransferase domain-containing protein
MSTFEYLGISMYPKLSIIIPTYNRPQLLPRTLRFLQAGPRLPMVVADGSEVSIASANAEICRGLGENISYFHIPNADNGAVAVRNNSFQRVQKALGMVETPYVTFCADDDLLMVESALASVKFLEENKEYSGCQGLSFRFRYEPLGLRVEGVEYDDASIDGQDAGTRLMQLFSRYESPFYCVSRTSFQRRVADRLDAMTSFAFAELLQATAVVLEGKLKRLYDIHYLRNVETTTASSAPVSTREDVPSANFIQWLANDPEEVFDAYKEHRSKVIEFAEWSNNHRSDLGTLERALDMTFVIYVGRQFRLDQWIDEYISRNVAQQCERNMLKERFYRNFGVEWSSPTLPRLAQRDRLLRWVKNPSIPIRGLKARINARKRPTFCVHEGSDGLQLAIRSPLNELFPKEKWKTLLRRLEQSTR